MVVSLLRGEAAAQEIQLAIEYAPNPVFHSGTPDSAPVEVLQSFERKYDPIGAARGQRRFAMPQTAHAHSFDERRQLSIGRRCSFQNLSQIECVLNRELSPEVAIGAADLFSPQDRQCGEMSRYGSQGRNIAKEHIAIAAGVVGLLRRDRQVFTDAPPSPND